MIRDLIARIYFLEDTVTKLKREPDAVKERVAEASPEVNQRLSQSRPTSSSSYTTA